MLVMIIGSIIVIFIYGVEKLASHLIFIPMFVKIVNTLIELIHTRSYEWFCQCIRKFLGSTAIFQVLTATSMDLV